MASLTTTLTLYSFTPPFHQVSTSSILCQSWFVYFSSTGFYFPFASNVNTCLSRAIFVSGGFVDDIRHDFTYRSLFRRDSLNSSPHYKHHQRLLKELGHLPLHVEKVRWLYFNSYTSFLSCACLLPCSTVLMARPAGRGACLGLNGSQVSGKHHILSSLA